MEDSDISRQLNRSISKIVIDNKGYKAAHAILISWADADDKEIANEVKLVRSLFEEQFGFNVSEYLIPSEDPELNLQRILIDICMSYNRGHDANDLLVFYYAGHGDANPDQGRAIWAAWEHPCFEFRYCLGF